MVGKWMQIGAQAQVSAQHMGRWCVACALLAPSLQGLLSAEEAAVEAEAPVAEAEAAVDPQAPNLSPEQQELFEQMAAQLDLQQAKAVGQNHYLAARSFYVKAEYEKAKESIDQAIAAYPANDKFQDLREDILTALGDRPAEIHANLDHIQANIAVEIEAAVVEVRTEIESGDKAMGAKAYQEAFRHYDRAWISIQTFPHQYDWGSLPAALQGKKLRAYNLAHQEALERDKKVKQQSAQIAADRAQLQEQALRAQVNQMLKLASEAFEKGFFDRAARDAWSAYELDRRREDARELYLRARRRQHVQFEEHYREARQEGIARVHEEIHQAMIPQTDLLVFPEDWDRRSLRTPDLLIDEALAPWQEELDKLLEQEVTFSWVDTEVIDAIEFLRRTTSVNFVVDNEVSINPPPPITLNARNMKLRTALNWLAQLGALKWTMLDEAIFIGTGDAEGDISVQLYNISDLISPVQDFPGVTLSVGGGVDGTSFSVEGDIAEGNEVTEDDVITFIEQSVAPESWGDPGVAITSRSGGQLFIAQTPGVHRLIVELLTKIRNQTKLQVNVKIRLLDLRKAFFEEIGVSWNDFQSDILNNPFSSRGASTISNEWAAGADVAHVMPGDAFTAPLNRGFGQGLRFEYIYSDPISALDNTQVQAVLEAIEGETDSQIVRQPEVTCFNGQRSSANFVSQASYISDYEVSADDVPDPTVEILNVGDVIDVRPLVSADRKYITLEVRPSSVELIDVFIEQITTLVVIGGGGDDLGFVTSLTVPIELPNIEIKQLRSTVILPDKGSMLLGGYVQGLRQRTHSGIPFLSHIPFLGRLFSKNGIYDENRRLYFLLTAEIIDLGEREAAQ